MERVGELAAEPLPGGRGPVTEAVAAGVETGVETGVERVTETAVEKAAVAEPLPGGRGSETVDKEALAELLFAVWSRRGVVVVTGESGAGKTALLTSLGDHLKRDGVEFAFLLTAPAATGELWEMLAYDMELRCSGLSKVEVLLALRAVATRQSARGSTTVLMFDDAHLMSEGVLLEIEALAGLGERKVKAVQVILAGRPELVDTLDKGELRGLRMQVGRWMRLGGGADGDAA